MDSRTIAQFDSAGILWTKTPISTLAEAKDIPIGIIKGHAAIPVLEQLGFSKLDEGASNSDMIMNKLLNKRFDTIVDAKVVYLYTWKKMGQKTQDLQEGPMIGEQSHIYVAGDLSFPDDIAKSISDAIDKMKKSGKLQEILDKWTK